MNSSLIRFQNRCLTLGGVIFIAACAITPPVDDLSDTQWAVRQTQLQALETWMLSGRIAVFDDQDGWHANLHWHQRGPAYIIDLIGPLGQGRLHIQGGPQGVTIRTADGQVLTAEHPESLLQQAAGIRIPLDGLMYWVRGLPDPARSSQLQGNQQGRLLRLEQDNWIIEYPRYEQVADLALPTQIRAHRGDLRLKLVVKEWRLQPSSMAELGSLSDS